MLIELAKLCSFAVPLTLMRYIAIGLIHQLGRNSADACLARYRQGVARTVGVPSRDEEAR